MDLDSDLDPVTELKTPEEFDWFILFCLFLFCFFLLSFILSFFFVFFGGGG